MLTQSDWLTAIRDVGWELCKRAQIIEPPVDALRIARVAGLIVAVDRSQAGRGRLKRIDGRAAMLLRPEPRPERLQWTAAHEIGEWQFERVCRAAGIRGDELSHGQREEVANRFATELLLPFEWFRRDCDELNFDLPSLKSRYVTASHELIAWRFLDLERPGIVTIFDQGRLTRRRGNTQTAPPLLTGEQACRRQLLRMRVVHVESDPPFIVRGWCVDSPGWEREILYASTDGAAECD